MNAALIFLTFAVSLPGLLLPNNRLWLKAHSWLVVGCASVTLILGLEIWFSTLQTRASLGVMWGQQTPHMQSLLQQKVPKPYDLVADIELTVISSIAVGILPYHSSKTPFVRAPPLLRICLTALAHLATSLMVSWI